MNQHCCLSARKELVEFYQRWYVPSNIVLVVCGNVDKRSALDEVVKKYGNMSPAKVESSVVPARASAEAVALSPT